MIISRTPVRISLFGGGTDYREYYSNGSGAVIGTTINKYVYVSINRLSDFFEYKIRVGYSKSELVNSVDQIVHPSVRECLRHKNVEGNLDIHIFADLPARTGLGSSSAFTVGFLHALYALEGKVATKERLATDALHVEQNMIQENVGSQDQIHASYGGLNVIEFGPDKFRVRPLIISGRKRQLLEDSIMIFYTSQTRYANEILKEQVERTRSRDNDAYLKKMHDMVYEAIDVISNENEESFIKSLGMMLDKSWRLKKSLSSQVSNTLIDDAYELALRAGAYGGKVAGAGGGGFLMMIVEPIKQEDVRKALATYLEVKFKFDTSGSTIIYHQP